MTICPVCGRSIRMTSEALARWARDLPVMGPGTVVPVSSLAEADALTEIMAADVPMELPDDELVASSL